MTDLTDYKTTEQVADALGITTGRVRQLARKLNLGVMIGRGRLYSERDVAVMRTRATKPGRRNGAVTNPCFPTG